MPQGASLSELEFSLWLLQTSRRQNSRTRPNIFMRRIKKMTRKKKKKTRFGSSSSSLPVSLFFFLAGQFCLKSQQNTKLGSVFHTERPSYHEKLTSFLKSESRQLSKVVLLMYVLVYIDIYT